MKNKPLLKKLLITVVLIFIFCCSVWLLRRPMMRWLGAGLIKEDTLQQSDAIFILSGNPEARAKQAASLYRSGYAKRLVCTGESIPELLESFELNVRE
jgi:uncharacterized SAM-binding protein YcdF (DUF218 family)